MTAAPPPRRCAATRRRRREGGHRRVPGGGGRRRGQARRRPSPPGLSPPVVASSSGGPPRAAPRAPARRGRPWATPARPPARPPPVRAWRPGRPQTFPRPFSCFPPTERDARHRGKGGGGDPPLPHSTQGSLGSTPESQCDESSRRAAVRNPWATRKPRGPRPGLGGIREDRRWGPQEIIMFVHSTPRYLVFSGLSAIGEESPGQCGFSARGKSGARGKLPAERKAWGSELPGGVIWR